MSARRTLTRDEAEAVYDRIGAWQDTQSVYEAPALDDLAAHGRFEGARSLFEVGCGTGRFAERLLRERCPAQTRYVGVDLSARMVEVARERLASFGARATVRQSDGGLTFDCPANSQDRVLATYVLDLLARDDAQTLLAEAHRLLKEHGRLCLAGLTWGEGLVATGVSVLWDRLQAIRPRWVGGCRPIEERVLLASSCWQIEHHRKVTAWGVPSEVLVASPT